MQTPPTMDRWWIISLLVVTLGISTVNAASRDQWIGRSIYQIVTDRFARSDNSTTAACDAAQGNYCGGSFQGIINKLNYIQDLGFDAIWISPAQTQISARTADLSAYHGYWPSDLYSINSHFGTPKELQALSSALHDRGMYLMLDIVVGDMAWAGNSSTVDYSTFNPFDDEKYFHDFKLLSSDPTNETCVLDCWMGDTVVSLPDLRNEDEQVQIILGSWISELVSNYSIDGLRIDSVLNIAPNFFSNFTKSSGVFTVGEGATADAADVCPLQPSLNGLLNYPLYYILTDAFNTTNGNLSTITESISYTKGQCEDVLALGTFTANQDVPRFGSYTSDISLARNILTSSMLADGIPILYYGEEQHLTGSYNPVNREALWLTNYSMHSTSLPTLVQSLNRLRSYASGDGEQYTEKSQSGSNYLSYLSAPIYNSTHILATRKGFAGNQVVSVVSNLGAKPASKATTKITLGSDETGFQSKQNVTEILSCKTYVTDSSGNLAVDLSSDGGPRVYYPTDSLKDSTDICGDQTKSATPSSSAASSVSPIQSKGSDTCLFGVPLGISTLMVTVAMATSYAFI
ncbi:alpha-amylase [Aspergillus eucalypticola CBS 122712]|uniref:alpha-amylase n=1 Tax=Aspergillus eucalypticola (strain CBS 122712 / IBT 29274) TaxID=1448314 RepID=A0A317UR47_ASPEC|nr:alpha-amylase [Aspergillus eucalypticola CBS 122712]PWY63676.1 alpha-amylase [Aspergillus eucalypticola CBS 122712]